MDTTPGLEVRLGRLLDVLRPPCTIASSATGWRLASAEDAMGHPGVCAVARALGETAGSAIGSAIGNGNGNGNRNGGLVKVLIGEIPIPMDLTPSFAFATLSLNVRTRFSSSSSS